MNRRKDRRDRAEAMSRLSAALAEHGAADDRVKELRRQLGFSPLAYHRLAEQREIAAERVIALLRRMLLNEEL